MTDQYESKTNFAGTYFDRDSILRLARLAGIFAWIALAFFVMQSALSVLVFILQIARGLITVLGFTDAAQQVFWMLQPMVPGVLYFIGIQAIGKFLLMMMDIEDNLRRAARNKS